MNKDYCAMVTIDFLGSYLSDIILDNGQIKLACNAIQFLENKRVISVRLGEKLKAIISENADRSYEKQHDSQEKEKEAPNQNDLTHQVTELIEQNRELKLLVLALTDQQAEMAKQIATLRRDQERILEVLANPKCEHEIKADGISNSPSFFRKQ